MKMNNGTLTDERHGINDVGEFTIATTPELFSLLSDGLYTDKILAPIRELSCNAWDAHKEIGKENEQFKIHLPNNIEPWFSIRDYGSGLAHKDVIGLYTTYGGSTKQKSNATIGGFGVGSKSPFAYSDSFTVISFHNGEKRSYTAFKDEHGKPNMAVMSAPEKTDEPSGMEVSFPVSQKDFSTFYQRARTVLRRFDPLPEVTGGFESFKLEPVEYSRTGKGWRIASNAAGSKAIMGNIAYPIESNSMEGLTSQHYNLFANHSIEIDFPIGSLDLAASREGLGYKPRTVAALKAKADEIIDELQKTLSKELKDKKTLWDAKIYYDDACSEFKNLDFVLKWRGQEIDSDYIKIDFKDFESVNAVSAKVRYSGNLEKYPQRGSVYITPTSTTVVVIDDLKKGIWARLKHRLTHTSSKEGDLTRAYVLTPCANPEDAADFETEVKKVIKDLGNPPVILASSLDKPPQKERNNVQKAKVLLRTDGQSKYDRDLWEETEIDLTHGGYFVEIRNYRSLDHNREPFFQRFDNYGRVTENEGRCMNSLISMLKDLGLMPEKAKVYGIRTADLKQMKGNWKNVFDVAQRGAKRLIKKRDLSSYLAKRDAAANFNAPKIVSLTTWAELESGVFYDFIKLFNEVKEHATKKDPVAEKLAKLAGIFEIPVKAGDKVDLREEWIKVKKTYPLLDMINISSYYSISEYEKEKVIEYLNLVDNA